jgi:hypothetical protein
MATVDPTKFTLRWGIASLALTGGLLVGGADALANANPGVAPAPQGECQSSPAVVITGGSVTNTTNVDLSANGGTGIADASGGNENLAAQGGGGGGGGRDDDGGSDVAAAGNGGGADAAANGGAIGVQDINSGSNAGNAMAVGDTWDGNLCDGVPAVSVDGGTVTNTTNVDISADGGTAIADASGGDNNVAVNGGSAGNGGSSTTGSAGNGGSANANANGGAISVGDINSGSNSGNVISVGDTVAGPAPIVPIEPGKPVPGKPVPGKPGDKPKVVTITPKGGKKIVNEVPSTGAGTAAQVGSVALLAGAAGAGLLAAGLSGGLGLKLTLGFAPAAVRRREESN